METQLYYHDVPFRPMSTAPTDGKTIMLARKSLSPAAKWMADIGCYESGTRPYWSSRLGLYASECRSNPPLGWLPLTVAERDSGDCRSCLGELCTAGPDCVATSHPETPRADLLARILDGVGSGDLEPEEAQKDIEALFSDALMARLLDRLGFGLAGDKELGRINVSVKTKPGTATYLYTAQELINELEKDRA